MIRTTQSVISKDITHVVNACLEFCKDNDYAMAIWRNPTNKSTHLIIDFSNELEEVTMSIDDLPTGFILAPFDKTQKKYFLKAQFCLDLVNMAIDHKQDLEVSDKVDQFNSYLKSFHHTPNENPLQLVIKGDIKTEQKAFEGIIKNAINSIKQGIFQKVVPSRKKTLSYSQNPDLGTHFKNLCDTYANAFVSLTYSKQTGLWLGATPELLIGIDENRVFKTVALAGTQKYHSHININEVAWTQKEIEEQALVSRYIINCFKKIRLREFEESGPKTVVAGDLLHLKTVYTVNMDETNFPQLGSVMLDLLHPTSAICGMPLEPSEVFLAKEEGLDRALFSGYIGPVNFKKTTDIYVNLRCMQIFENEIVLYAGSGVTEDSSPTKEWLETEMKMNTLLNVIK